MSHYQFEESNEKRIALVAKAEKILNAAESRANKGMTESEEREFSALMKEAEDLKMAGVDKRNATRPGGMGQPNDTDDEPALRLRTPEGKEIRALRPNERMADLSPYRDALDPGKFFRGILTGDWRQADAEYRAASEGTLTGGGYLLASPLAAYIIDRARNMAVLMRAGALTVPMDTSTLAIARVTGDVQTAWMQENAAQTSTDAGFDRVTLTAKTLSAMTRASIELAEDTNFADVIAGQLSKVIAIALDAAGLEGVGTGATPAGMLNAAGVGSDATTFGANGSLISGSSPTGSVGYDWVSKAIAAVRALNEYPNSIVYSERTAGELDLLRTTIGSPLPPPLSMAALKSFSTNAVSNAQTQGTSNVASNAYLFDASKIAFGIRNAISIEISREAADSTSSAMSNRQVWIRAYGRYDFACFRPASIRVVKGIL